MKVLSIFGTRPEAIKMAPVVKELGSSDGIESVVLVTAQHRDMLDQVLSVFDIKPDYDLNIMKDGQTLSYITAEVLQKVEEILIREKPDLVLVHGDTTTAMSAALAAFYQQIKIGHVEAGLRTYDKYSPFPEEINRQVIDRVADYLFAPTELSKQNLESNLNRNQRIFVTGNTAIDALKMTVNADYQNPDLEWAKDARLILVTAHRRENMGEPMRNIFTAIRKLADVYPDVKIIYPVHLNPQIRAQAQEVLGGHKRIRLIEPLDVIDFHNFMNQAYIIMSDSGGVQEEAPALGKPVLVLREVTERPEGIEAGTLRLAGVEAKKIFQEASKLLSDAGLYAKMSQAKNPYGNGLASKYIVDTILNN